MHEKTDEDDNNDHIAEKIWLYLSFIATSPGTEGTINSKK